MVGTGQVNGRKIAPKATLLGCPEKFLKAQSPGCHHQGGLKKRNNRIEKVSEGSGKNLHVKLTASCVILFLYLETELLTIRCVVGKPPL